MLTRTANGDSRTSFWRRVREYAVPPSMIETATARRQVGDWAGACSAAHVEVDFRLRDVAHTHGRELAGRLRADLRQLAPDLLRWHLPRTAPDGLLRPGLTMALARYGAEVAEPPGPLFLVVRTPPAWASYGQRISLALWSPSNDGGPRLHPHPRPGRRFRFDLHRHLWDAGRSGELRARSGADREAPTELPGTALGVLAERCAVDRWAAEAAILLSAEGRPAGPVAVRLGRGRRLVLEPDGGVTASPAEAHDGPHALPLLPDAATWVLPDLDLLRTGAIEADRLHPLVAQALAPDRPAGTAPSGAEQPERPGRPQLVECRGARHRIGLVDGVLAPLDHSPAELRREELLAALSGTPLPCLQAVDRAHRTPQSLTGVQERLDHGDIAGALAIVEGLLGPGAVLRPGPLRDELEAAAQRRIGYGLYRAGLAGPAPFRVLPGPQRPARHRSHPRHTTGR
ncbi:hypothetical protein [Kitasatospora sp. NPDC097643]|uniref:hypothetical protein n=1 Tax=Kitasatospora sp. NPDC097643 TaxID=3157230 RepID=UPI003330E3AA